MLSQPQLSYILPLTSVNPVKCVLIWPEISSLRTQLQDKRLLGPRRLPVDVLVHSPVSAGCIVFTPCMWPQTNSHCVRRRHYTHTLSHTHTHTRARTQTHLRHVPVAPTVLWWRLRLFLFNGACISDAFDNHVHISELSELSRQQAKSDWLCFCLYFSWNKSWMIINSTPSELAHLRNLALSGRTVGQHFNTQPAQGCMNVDIQQTLSGRLTDMQPPCRTDV